MSDDALETDAEKETLESSDDLDLAGFDWGSDLGELTEHEDDLFAGLGLDDSQSDKLDQDLGSAHEGLEDDLDLSGLGLTADQDEDALQALVMDEYGLMLDDEKHESTAVLDEEDSLDLNSLLATDSDDELSTLDFGENDAVHAEPEEEEPWYEQVASEPVDLNRLGMGEDEDDADELDLSPLDVAVSQLDFLELSELKELIKEAEMRVHQIELENMEKLDQYLREKAQELGVNVEAFLKNKGLFVQAEASEQPVPVEIEIDKKKKKAETVKPYVNPNNPEERWSGNIKGRKPEWVNHELDKAMIKYKGWDREVVLVEIMQAWLSE